jgi:hypothetical protein
MRARDFGLKRAPFVVGNVLSRPLRTKAYTALRHHRAQSLIGNTDR